MKRSSKLKSQNWGRLALGLAVICNFAFCILHCSADGFNARYTFTDFGQNPITTRRMNVYPLWIVTVSGTNLVTGDRLTYTNDSTGNVIVSNMVAGGYKIEFLGQYTTTIFTNVFGTNVAGNVSAKDYVTAMLQVNPATVAYSQAQADARFHRRAGDSSTNATFRGTFTLPDGATLTYVWTCTNATTGAGAWQAASGGSVDLAMTNLAAGARITLANPTAAMNYTITADTSVPGFLGITAGFQRSAFITVTNSTAIARLLTFPQSVNFQGTNVLYIDATNQVSVTIFYNGAATNGFKANNYRLP